MRIVKSVIAAGLILVFTVSPVFANYAFFKKVSTTCKSYRISLKPGDMTFSDNGFQLSLNSNRNNFEMVMLIGFAAAGQAIIHQKYLADVKDGYEAVIPGEVQVIVNVPQGRETQLISASASPDLVTSLADGSLDPAEFMRRIKDTIQTL